MLVEPSKGSIVEANGEGAPRKCPFKETRILDGGRKNAAAGTTGCGSETCGKRRQIAAQFFFHAQKASWSFPTSSIGKIQIASKGLPLDISNMADLQKIVVERLAELDRNPFEAARIGGLERSFVNDIVIGKKTSIRGANMAKLAFGLDWPVARLMNNAEQFDGHTFVVSVMGRIGAGAEIMPEFEQVPPEGLYEIAVQFPVGAEALAFEVDGDSMYPRYDAGDVVICGREGMDAQEIVGWEAAVRTADGRRFLKRIRRGSAPGLFNLESHNASPIEDVRIDWAAEIEHVVRRGKWKKLDEAAQKRLITRTMKGKKR